ncbi:protein-glutamate O-methyltransferase family protein [Anaerolineae bacterium CFX7]|nr:protein-glutamate O-methyltransferase family protein [Anaerolineae bacterium CFX7]
MSQPHLPRPRIDLQTLPPLLATGDAGSFAQATLKVRDPRILQDLENAPYFAPTMQRGLAKLRAEILHGAIQTLREDAPDADFWRQVSKPYIGRSWLDAPWYWAETYFYRRILEITRYFQVGAWHERDPFAPLKDAELQPDAAPARVASIMQSAAQDAALAERDVFAWFLHAALWGNRVDLSYNVERMHGRAAHLHDERENLLADDVGVVWEFFQSQRVRQLVYVADNAGTELALDLAAIDFLLQEKTSAKERPYADQIVMHLKPQPFYVSDAMPQDVLRTLDAFEKANDATRALAQRLRAHLQTKRLTLRTHWFYPTPLHYFEMPDDLWALMRAADFVILKGDVNYRRAVGDAHWNPTMRFEYPTRYFPVPFVALRTLKSDALVGLRAEQVSALNQTDTAWRVNGKRGVAQANLQPGRRDL